MSDNETGGLLTETEKANPSPQPIFVMKPAGPAVAEVPPMQVDSKGLVCLHRKIFESAVFCTKDHLLYKIWTWAFAQAAWKDHQIIYHNIVINLKRGQFVCGRETAAEKLHTSVKKFRLRLAKLQNMGNLVSETASGLTLVTIVKYDDYQHDPEKGASKRASGGPAVGQDRARTGPQQNKGNTGNDVNLDNKQRARKTRTKPPSDPRIRQFIDYFHDAFKTSRGSAYVFAPGKDGARVGKLLKSLSVHDVDGLARLEAAADAMLADKDDFTQRGAGIGLLSASINKWLVIADKKIVGEKGWEKWKRPADAP
jgi:hypothetical protein